MGRSTIMSALLLVPLCAVARGADAPAPGGRPNVLMISIDDLNDWVGPLGGHPQVRTPHMDRLAARGVVFTNAHCQAPLCNPSRASLLTGLRPGTTGVYALEPWFRDDPKFRDHETLFQYFRRHGYRTMTCGKVFHDAYPPAAGSIGTASRDP
jgi:choline-sulfatase